MAAQKHPSGYIEERRLHNPLSILCLLPQAPTPELSYQPPCELTVSTLTTMKVSSTPRRAGPVITKDGWYKYLIGPKLCARSLASQRGEVAIAVAVLNRMIRTAKPVIVRIA